jgi:hypothetical protein
LCNLYAQHAHHRVRRINVVSALNFSPALSLHSAFSFFRCLTILMCFFCRRSRHKQASSRRDAPIVHRHQVIGGRGELGHFSMGRDDPGSRSGPAPSPILHETETSRGIDGEISARSKHKHLTRHSFIQGVDGAIPARMSRSSVTLRPTEQRMLAVPDQRLDRAPSLRRL